MPISVFHFLYPHWPPDNTLVASGSPKTPPRPRTVSQAGPTLPPFCTTLAPSRPSRLSIFNFHSSTHLEFIQTFSHDYFLSFCRYELSIHALSQQMLSKHNILGLCLCRRSTLIMLLVKRNTKSTEKAQNGLNKRDFLICITEKSRSLASSMG